MSPEIQAHYHVRDYVDKMGLAFAVADLAICRAGASTLSEFPAFGLPSILIPLAYTWRYQEINADWLASRGAAIRLDEDQMPTQLVPLVHDLFRAPERLGKMREAALTLSHTDGAANIARVILNQARQPSRGTG
jgi:UDP-N-acetylglucosamine--N-acetylmuramyl-(pentapeptide) pyrophosphoryl-undecaprenol N-acetylglucosamine transferase